MQDRRRKAAQTGPPGVRAALAALAAAGTLAAAPALAQCGVNNTTTADVVAIDQVLWYNRLGAHDPAGMIFALKDDVVPNSGYSTLTPGNVRLRDGKRPRPLVLRVRQGECLVVNFTNLLSPTPKDNQPGTRAASIHVAGMQLELTNGILNDGSNVGENATSLVEPGASRTYGLLAAKEGAYLLYSTAQTTGGDGDGGQLSKGLFGVVNVEPPQSEWYRSQVTAEELRLAQRKDGFGNPVSTPGGQPVINYDAVYPTGHPRAGLPILNMVQAGKLVHSDLTAIITGPNKGNFADSVYPEVRVSPQRNRPFREVTVVFHDEIGIVQAFDNIFEDPQFEHTLHSGRDAFAVNYGTGGIGAEVIANRFGVGPMWKCNECKYEEFFLSSWTVGDPAMIVDVPADADANADGLPDPGPKATKVFFPDDPSNVYHTYLNDHVKIRNVHAGPKEHHVFHLHAHQWLHTPDSDGSSILDSQSIGPGGAYTYELLHGGAGNRTKTPGDAIFHCHFYPHFAQGMWGHLRVHDVFERGTTLDANGRPTASARKLPDGEIAAGTPIPALVPLPTYALAPMPTSAMPGYPFYIPGVAGHRPPKPPLDTRFDGGLPRHVVTGGTATFPALNRFDFHKENVTIIANALPEAGTTLEQNAMTYHARRSQPTYRFNPLTFAVVADSFRTNGRPRAAGAPYADPCVDDFGNPQDADPRIYKVASFQLDSIRYNKAYWQFRQHRMLGLWFDVDSFRQGTRPPEPWVIRAHSTDCLESRLVNLIPKDYELDDFQVRSPTDVIGQHIHLVKFDVTSADGAANGFNYEDGSFAPGETVERVHAIRRQNGCTGLDSGDARDGTFTCPVAQPHPFFGAGPAGSWVGAQETVQRWFVDEVENAAGADRTLRTVFTHDHFGPSTHQQTGLYAGVAVEPLGSRWFDPETGVELGVDAARGDGGPTSWRADIHTINPDSSYREFNLLFGDFSLAYDSAAVTFPDPQRAINPPGRQEVGLPFLLRPPAALNECPDDITPIPCPELVSADDPGTMTVNYRNEPLALRVRNPFNNQQAQGDSGDLSLAFASDVERADPRFNRVGPYRPLTADVQPGDPFTPLLRVYEDDKVQIRVLVGAHEEGHDFSVHGTEWLFEPSDSASGYRNGQMMGISEHFEFVLPPLTDNLDGDQVDYLYQAGSAVDDLWNGIWGIIRAYRYTRDDLIPLPMNLDASTALQMALAEQAEVLELSGGPSDAFTLTEREDSLAWEQDEAPEPIIGPDGGYGTVTIVETEDPVTGEITWDTVAPPPPSSDTTVIGDPAAGANVDSNGNPIDTGELPQDTVTSFSSTSFNGICPRGAPVRIFDVSAVEAQHAIPVGAITYNSRTQNGGPLMDDTGLLYVYTSDLELSGGHWRLKAGVQIEPLVLRAAAGDCIQLRLRNRFVAQLLDQDGFNTFPMIVDLFNANQVHPSPQVGLHPQLVAYDPTRSDGSKVGLNPRTVVSPGKYRDYQWFAGQVVLENGALRAFSVEYGASNLTSSDRMKHSNKGAIAALIVEPRGTAWQPLPDSSRTRALVYRTRDGRRMFKEQVLLFQDDLNLQFGDNATLPKDSSSSASFAPGDPVPNLAEAEDPEDSGQKAVNYRTEPLWFRMGFAPNADLRYTRTLDFRNSLKSALVNANPETPILVANAGDAVRYRILEPGGHARNHVFNLHGHVWQELPFNQGSTRIDTNPLSEDKGMRDGHGPATHYNIIPRNGAGGRHRVPGDYLWRDQSSFLFDGGIWGLLRVRKPGYVPADPPNPTPPPVFSCHVDENGVTVCTWG